MCIQGKIFEIKTTEDPIIFIKYLNLLLFAFFITSMTANTVSIENVAMLDQCVST